jgi:hypothetical protein
MKIIEILKQRSNKPKDDVKIELKLYNLADDLEKKCRAHLKRIISVMPEFDLHDETHSEKIIENIEMLLGNEKLNSLSTYELFLLYLSAFFHDCAMAPSDWEINTMKLTEGNEQYFQVDFSIKHDLKTPLKFSVAKEIIIAKETHLYKKFESDIKNWIFTPHSKDELITYLSSLLIEYQNYRNGFTDKLKGVKDSSEFAELNESIRVDYIRATHHTRIETYIKNLETTFGVALPACGKKLARDLSLICKSHGEDVDFIKNMNVNAQYYGPESANLQFVAMLLRLGDIIHFSYDRAPVDLRSSRLFNSKYSFLQWVIKDSGVNYSIDKGKISFRSHCETPDTYFKLHQYIDWIEIEIQNYFRFQRQWSRNYIDNLQDNVGRKGITNDEEAFLPKRGLSFSLNQAKIIDLLMGVGLYKDKYACLRELYQNSLDAVRCMLSKNELENCSTYGNIEFRIDKEAGKRYLCCIDNGIGMTKDVIENYLLKIGDSYYKSADFYKQQAMWDAKFTPTSQFGIGILSCFMIGNEIEITTKMITNEYISCTIDGPHENFYYKKTSLKDKEDIPVSGTIVKILLNDELANQINNKKVSKIGLLLSLYNTGGIFEYSEHFPFHTKEEWDCHLFNIINEYISIVPKNICVFVRVEDGNRLPILSKPILIDFENPDLGIETSDFGSIDEIFDYLNNGKKYESLKHLIKTYKFSVSFENTEFVTTLTLPTKDFLPESRDFVRANMGFICKLPTVYERERMQIDGISNDWNSYLDIYWHEPNLYWSKTLGYRGLLNFCGEVRPLLSVDRQKITSYPRDGERIAENISKLLAREIVSKTMEYIYINEFDTSNDVELIWEYVFEQFSCVGLFIIKELLDVECINITSEMLNLHLQTNKYSVRDFFNSESIELVNINLLRSNYFVQNIIWSKLIQSKEICVNHSKISVIQEEIQPDVWDITQKCQFFPILYSESYLLICANSWNILNGIYDIVSNLFPLVPKRLFDLLSEYMPKERYRDETRIENIDKRIKILKEPFPIDSGLLYRGLSAFFGQDPLAVNEKHGLYCDNDRGRFVFRERNAGNIYRFNTKIAFRLSEINQKNEEYYRYVLVVYICPYELTAEQNNELEKYKTIDPSYVKGVREGWSLLATSMKIDNIVICPGLTTREHLVSLISDDFWDAYKDFTFKFTDDTIMKKS